MAGCQKRSRTPTWQTSAQWSCAEKTKPLRSVLMGLNGAEISNSGTRELGCSGGSSPYKKIRQMLTLTLWRCMERNEFKSTRATPTLRRFRSGVTAPIDHNFLVLDALIYEYDYASCVHRRNPKGSRPSQISRATAKSVRFLRHSSSHKLSK